MSECPHTVDAICQQEGHDFGDKAICSRCGFRPRCMCGAFVSIDPDRYAAHVRKCAWWAEAEYREQEEIMAGWPR